MNAYSLIGCLVILLCLTRQSSAKSTQDGLLGELLTADCNGYVHVLPNFPTGYLVLSEVATVFDMAYVSMFDKINEHCDISQEDFDHYMTVSPEYILMLIVTGKLNDRPICTSAGSNYDLRLALPYYLLVTVRHMRDFEEIDVLPESCSLDSLSEGDGCLLQVNVMDKINEMTNNDLFDLQELNIGIAIDSCPSDSPSNLFFSVVCTSPACQKMGAPCELNGECGDGLNCIEIPETESTDFTTFKVDSFLRHALGDQQVFFNSEEDPSSCIGGEGAGEVTMANDFKNWIRDRFYDLPASDETTIGFCSPMNQNAFSELLEGGDEYQDEYTFNVNCNAGCYDSFIGDGDCDDACNNYECNYDEGDCEYQYKRKLLDEDSILDELDEAFVSWNGQLTHGNILDADRKSGEDLPFTNDVIAAMDPERFDASNVLTMTCDMVFMISKPFPKGLIYYPHLKPFINFFTDVLARIQNCRSPVSTHTHLTPEQFAIRFLPFHIDFWMYQLLESDALDDFDLGKNLKGDLLSLFDLERSSIFDGALMKLPETGTYEYWKKEGVWGLQYSGLSNYIGQELNVKIAAVECPVPNNYSDRILTMPAYSLRLDGAFMDLVMNPRGCESDSDCQKKYEVCTVWDESSLENVDFLTNAMFPSVSYKDYGNHADYEFLESIDYLSWMESSKSDDPDAFLHMAKDVVSTLFLQQPMDDSLDDHPYSVCTPKTSSIYSGNGNMDDDDYNDYFSVDIFQTWLESQMKHSGNTISMPQLESMSKADLDEMTASMTIPDNSVKRSYIGLILGLVFGGLALLGLIGLIVHLSSKKRNGNNKKYNVDTLHHQPASTPVQTVNSQAMLNPMAYPPNPNQGYVTTM